MTLTLQRPKNRFTLLKILQTRCKPMKAPKSTLPLAKANTLKGKIKFESTQLNSITIATKNKYIGKESQTHK